MRSTLYKCSAINYTPVKVAKFQYNYKWCIILIYIVVHTVDEWPEHVTFDNETKWIVVDDTTLKRPPKNKTTSVDNKKSPLALTHSCPTSGMKVT